MTSLPQNARQRHAGNDTAPLLVGGWATCTTCISKYAYDRAFLLPKLPLRLAGTATVHSWDQQPPHSPRFRCWFRAELPEFHGI